MSTLTFSIRVVDDEGDPVSNEDVYVVMSGILGGPSQTGNTDEDGWAEFEFIAKRFYGVAHVRGEEHEIIADDGDTFSITV